MARWSAVAGGKTPGLILYRLAFLQPRSKITRGGRPWVVMSRDRWCEELTCSMKTLERALTQLRKDGLIESEIHLIKGRTRSFMRLSSEAETRFSTTLSPPPETDKMSVSGYGQKGGNPIGLTALKEVNEEEVNSVCASAGANKVPGSGEGFGKGSKGGQAHTSPETPLTPQSPPVPPADHGDPTMAKAADILTKLSSQKHAHKPNTSKGLEFAWKTSLSETWGQGLVHVTAKQRGQMGLFLKRCPEGRADAMFGWLLENWIEFVKHVESMAGIKKTPAIPSMDFLLFHANLAVALATEALAPKPVPVKKPAKTPLANNPQVQLTSHQPGKGPHVTEDEEKPMTLEEILAPPPNLKGKDPK